MAHTAVSANPEFRTAAQSIELQRRIVTKLAKPRLRADLMSRPRLLALLDRGVEHKLTLISTGPGYGKSTLAAHWIESTKMSAAWLSLDEGDNDPYTLFSYLAAALQTLDPGLCPELAELLAAGRATSVRAMVSTLINELAVVTRPFALVLDDLHTIKSPEILEGFALLVKNLPHMLRLLVTTRTDPPLPLLRMRARGELLEIRAGDLSFTTDETHALLGDHYGLELSEPELAEIQEWSEGWPVGLMLVGQRMQDQSSQQRRALLERLEGDIRFVQDYLWQETIEHQPPERRRFLLQTSILDRFDADLCAVVTGLPDTGAMLRQLERENLFLIGLDGSGRWFRYHHLFADALRRRLAQESSPEAVRELYQRAAAWYLQNGTTEEAARYAIAGENWDIALPLLLSICAELNRDERIASLRQWLDQIPLDVLQREPHLYGWLAWALVRQGKVTQAMRMLDSIRDVWTEDEQQSVLGLVLQIRLLQAMYHQRLDEGLEHLDQALEIVDDRQPSERGRILVNAALLHSHTGDFGAAESCLRELRGLVEQSNSHALHLMELNASGGLLISRGRLRDAAALLERVVGDQEADVWNSVVVHYAHWKLASVLLEWNDLDGAERLLTNGFQITVKTATPMHRPLFHRYFAELAWARGDVERAEREIEQHLVLAHEIGGDGEVLLAKATLARFWLNQGSLERALDWARASGIDPTVEPDTVRFVPYLVFMRIMVQAGRAELVLDRIGPMVRRAEREGRLTDALALHLLVCNANESLDRRNAAMDALHQAMQIARPEGIKRPFLDYGHRLGPVLLQMAKQEDDEGAYARGLIELMGLASQLDRLRASDILSPREIEVLHLIAAGESNRQVGDHLFISEQTVKKHVSSILEKLSVSSRTQAIDRGRRLGII